MSVRKRVTKKIKKIDNDYFIIQKQFIVTYAFNVIVKIRVRYKSFHGIFLSIPRIENFKNGSRTNHHHHSH